MYIASYVYIFYVVMCVCIDRLMIFVFVLITADVNQELEVGPVVSEKLLGYYHISRVGIVILKSN